MISRHTILYAEDDEDDVFMIKKAFESHDHIQIVHAGNGLDALSILREMVQQKMSPCLIILDINMPVLDGKETLARIKQDERTSKIPIVLFSTSSSQGDQQFAKKWGVELFTKPLNYGDLEEIARMFVNRCNFEINKLD